MPHLKCVTCRTRLYTRASQTEPIDERCPGCGAAFETAGGLAELVGLRVVTPDERSAAGRVPSNQQGFVERLGDLLDHRARQEQVRLDAERTGHDPGSAVQAVALPRPGGQDNPQWNEGRAD